MAGSANLGTKEEFFKQLRAGSVKKQRIVADYFVYYNRVMTRRHDKVGYADLFAGPGVYVDSNGDSHKSIPILVTESAIREENFRQHLHLWFNEGDQGRWSQLQTAIHETPGVDSLRFQPSIQNKVIDRSWVSKMRKLTVPTLVFLDPCGYKGLSLSLVASILEGHGNDCIFFFNYSRINMKLDLDIMNDSIDEFFEPTRAHELRAAIAHKGPEEREGTILEAVNSAITDARGIPLSFRFKSEINRTSHHLVFATKFRQAAIQMKRIFSDASSSFAGGVGSGEHNPRADKVPPNLFTGLYEVEECLLAAYAGRTVSFQEIVMKEVSIRFTDTNFRDALLKLEAEGRVTMNPPANKRPFQAGGKKRTLAKKVQITFDSEVARGN